MAYKLRNGARHFPWHLSLISLFIGLMWAGIGVTLWHDHDMAVRDAESDTANLARAFDENTTRTVEAVDLTLLFLRDAYQHDPAGFAGRTWAGGLSLLNDLHMRMALADADGKVIWSNVVSVPGTINIGDREHFQGQKNSEDDSLFISRPMLGRVSGRWSILLSRKLLTPDGLFAGIAVVSLDPRYLSRFYESISIGHGSIIIGTVSGTILARVPGGELLTGATMPADMRARITAGTTRGSYRTVSSIDQVERIFSSRRLERYPLVVAVGLATADVLAPFERNRSLYSLVGAVLSAASIIVGLLLVRQRRSLLNSRQALTITLENISQGITMVDAVGRIRVLNQRAVELLGLPPALVAAKPTFRQIVDWQFTHDEFGERDSHDSLMIRALWTGGLPNGDYTYERTRPNGTVLEVRSQRLAEGGMVRTFTDITQRKQNEAALATARARAAHAERMQVLGQLAGGIAHDFNNILQAVQGCAGLLDRRADDPDSIRRFARMILDAAERGTSITGRLLTFARRGELRAEAIEVPAMLAGLREVLSHTLGSPVTVELRLDDDLPPLLADKGQLETVLVNLATNARDAMPHGGTLTFAVASLVVTPNTAQTADLHLQAGRYVRLSIADTGCGMDKEMVNKALEPFFSTKPPGQGTGLGLSMAKGFLEQSGGALAIDSTPGVGTAVHLWLPATIRTETVATVLAAVPVPTATRRSEVGKRILLVDDEAVVRETLAASLQDAGYAVRVAAGAEEALETLASEVPIDVLVTDLSMPDTDGLALIRQARRYRPGLSAVLLTGYAGHGAQLAIGGSIGSMFTLVRKPVTAAQLADRIEALLTVPLTN